MSNSIKITNTRRDNIMKRAVDLAVGDMVNEYIRDRRSLVVDTRDWFLKDPDRELIGKIPKTWLVMMSRHPTFSFDGEVVMLTTYEAVLYDIPAKAVHSIHDVFFPDYLLEGVLAVNSDDGDVARDLCERAMDLKIRKSEIRLIAEQVSGMVRGILAEHTTLNRLVKKWPEAINLLSSRDASVLKGDTPKSLPACLYDLEDLNAKLGFHPSPDPEPGDTIKVDW